MNIRYPYFIASSYLVFFFNDTATTEIYTLSLHDALPISPPGTASPARGYARRPDSSASTAAGSRAGLLTASGGRERSTLTRSEEHTSELQSRQYLVCRLLLEKKKH